MNPSRPPGGEPGHNRNRKADPALAPSVPESEHTRKIPAPRGADDQASACAKKAAEEDAEKEEPCCICCTQLPDVGQGIIPCGHVFCFYCIQKWSKNANVCPTCRLEFTKISKTMSLKDLTKEEAHREGNKNKKCTTKRKAARGKTPVEGVYVKVFRVRKKTQNLTPAQQAALPHPQAPGGFLHVPGGPAAGVAAGVAAGAAAGAAADMGGYLAGGFTQLQEQRDQLHVEQAVTRAREEAAEEQSRARAARQQAVAARQQAVRAAELAAEDEAREARDRTAAAAAAAAEQEEQEQEEEEEEESRWSLGVNGWTRRRREAVVDADTSDDEVTPGTMMDADSAWFGPGTSVGWGQEHIQRAAAPSQTVAAAAAVSQGSNTWVGVASTVGARTRDTYLGRFTASVEQAEREREQRREEDRSRRLDWPSVDEEVEDEGRERQRSLKRERRQELQREREQLQQQQDEVGQPREAMQRRGRQRLELRNTAVAEAAAEEEAAITPLSLLAQVAQQYGGFAALPGQPESLPSSDPSPWISLALVATAAAGPTTPTAPLEV